MSVEVEQAAQADRPSPATILAKLKEGVLLHRQGKLAEAEQLYIQALQLDPNNFDPLHLLGTVAIDTGRAERGVALIAKAIGINPNFALAHNNLGYALLKMGLSEQALASLDKAIALAPDLALAHNNRGWALLELSRYEEALASCDRAIALTSDYAPAHNNRGWALLKLKRFEEALASCDRAIALAPDYATAHNNRHIALYRLKRLEEALASCARAIQLEPDIEFVLGNFLHTKMMLCDWSDYSSIVAELCHRISRDEKVATPFPVLAAPSDIGLQRRASEIWIGAKCPGSSGLGEIPERPRHRRVRIGYFSADFHNHATAFLTAELFEGHDRSKFELVAFSFGPETGDEMQQRVKAAFDNFIDIRNMSDRDVALLARSLEIDIGVDLKGFTEDARTNMFAMRSAPIQVSYLGYPGTMGANYIDYIIADPTVIPASFQPYYTEKIVYLPNSYQPNDRRRQISDKLFTRSELGLPTRGFVFCCFNSNFKLTPDMFDSWMRILTRVEGSVLWLFEGNEIAARNLKKEASVRGVDPDRLVFAPRMALPDHLARHRLADLFLDTLPYNAHTTASDALWAGLPVLTQIGETFAGRVAASLLNAIDLPELATTTRDAYEALAVELAANPGKLAAIKRKLAANRLTTALFDSETFTKHIEAAYTMMYERRQAELPPDHLFVPK